MKLAEVKEVFAYFNSIGLDVSQEEWEDLPDVDKNFFRREVTRATK